MKRKKVANVYLIGSFSFLLLLSVYGLVKAQIQNDNHTSNEIAEKSKEDRLAYLRDLNRETLAKARERIFHGQYAEGIRIAEEGIAEFEDSDYEDSPIMAAGSHFVLGLIAEEAQLEFWKKAACAYEKSLEIAERQRETADYASNVSLSLANVYHMIGEHEKAEEHYLNAIRLADSTPRTDNSVSLISVKIKTRFLMYCREHGKRKGVEELIKELQDIIEIGYPPSDEEIRKEFREKPEIAERIMEHKQSQIDDLRKLLEDERKRLRDLE